jgi:dienelactone hydrolase
MLRSRTLTRARAAVAAAVVLTGCAALGSRLEVPLLSSATVKLHAQPAVPLVGYVFRPNTAGPRPAVILLHGCAGLQRDHPLQPTWTVLRDAAHRYTARGWVAMILDSYGPRGHGDLCGKSDVVVPYAVRGWDAAAAADALVRAGHAERTRIVLHGMSAGGASALSALSPVGPPAGTFAAAIAWYPVCEPWRVTRLHAPALVLAGGADTWTPAHRCEQIREQLGRGPGPEFALRIFDGATHSFDYPFPPHSFGPHRMRYDAHATRESWNVIESFLERHVR